MAKELLCFNCFHRFKPHEVWFRCENTARQDNQTEACPLEIDSKTKKMDRHAFPLHGFVPALASLWKAPLHCKCDVCGVESKERICPICHWKLPPGHGQLAEHIIAVVGNTNSGKSHYFTVLIERELKGAIGRAFGLAVNPADNETEALYNFEYRNPLFRQKRAIAATTIEERRHRRLLFRLDLPKLKQKLTFVFYDVAGELLSKIGDEFKVTNATRYLWNSSGIIYLVNPLDVDEWEPFLNGAGQLTGLRAEAPDVLFGRILRELREKKEIKQIKTIPIPVAVCISQFDRFYDRRTDAGLSDDLFDPALTPVRKGSIDHKDIQTESDLLKEFMLNAGGGISNTVQLAEQNFAAARFFAVSALGNSPLIDGAVPDIKPCRVGVPFFWILDQAGRSKGR
jgi:hypothetical protein